MTAHILIIVGVSAIWLLVIVVFFVWAFAKDR